MPTLSDIFADDGTTPDNASSAQPGTGFELDGAEGQDDNAEVGPDGASAGDQSGAGDGVQGGPDFAIESPQSGGGDSAQIYDA